MARPKSLSNLSPAEIKAQKANLKVALKDHMAAVKVHEIALKTANATFDSTRREAEKAIAAAQKSADKAIAAAAKVRAGEVKRHTKALEAAAKGTEKIEQQFSALEALANPAE